MHDHLDILKQLSAKQVMIVEQYVPLLRITWKTLFILIALLLFIQVDTHLLNVIVSTLSDAYLGVNIFVALTLAGFYALDSYFKANVSHLLNRRSVLQVPIAAFLGALPGCGGAIIVVTQFVHGQMSFGALVAVLIATMGDAAFLLIAKKTDAALIIYFVSMAAAMVFGDVVNRIHGYEYMKSYPLQGEKPAVADVAGLPNKLIKVFLLLLIPGSVLGILGLFQFDTNNWFGMLPTLEPTKYLGFAGAVFFFRWGGTFIGYSYWVCTRLRPTDFSDDLIY